MTNHQTIQSSKQADDADRGICESYNCSSLAKVSIFVSMPEVESLAHRRRRPILVTIPTASVDAISITQHDFVKMTLKNNSITIEKV